MGVGGGGCVVQLLLHKSLPEVYHPATVHTYLVQVLSGKNNIFAPFVDWPASQPFSYVIVTKVHRFF